MNSSGASAVRNLILFLAWCTSLRVCHFGISGSLRRRQLAMLFHPLWVRSFPPCCWHCSSLFLKNRCTSAFFTHSIVHCVGLKMDHTSLCSGLRTYIASSWTSELENIQSFSTVMFTESADFPQTFSVCLGCHALHDVLMTLHVC